MPSAPPTHALRSPRAWRWLVLMLVLLVCWFAFVPDPPQSVDTGWDKLNHVLAFGALSFSGWFAWGAPRRRMLGVVLGALMFGIFIEVVQTQIPGRSGEWPDLLADSVGIAIGIAMASTVTWRRLTS